MLPSESEEPALEKLTRSGATPDVGVAAALATGAWLGAVAVIATVAAGELSPPLSVTTSVAV